MLGPLRDRRRSRDRRSRRWPAAPIVVAPPATRPAIAKVIARRWSSRLSVARPVERPSAVDRRGRRRRPRRCAPSAPQPGRDARRSGPIPCGAARRRRGSSSCPRARAAARHRTGISSIAAATSSGADLDRRAARSTGREVGHRLADAVVGARVADAGRSSIRAPIRRSRSMTARRVGLTPTSRSVSSASGWIAPATSQNAAADMSPGTRSSTACTRTPPSRLQADLAPSPRRLARDVERRAPAASAPCDRASRPLRGPSSARRPAARPAGSPISPGRSERVSSRRSPGAGCDRPRSVAEGNRSGEHGAPRPSSAVAR